MTKLHKALERANHANHVEAHANHANPVETTAPEPVAEVFEASRGDEDLWGVASRVPRTAAATGIVAEEPSAVRRSSAMRCPACKQAGKSPLPGAWMKRVFQLLQIKPYRCRVCRHRFSDVDRESESGRQQERAVLPTFLQPADSRGFRDLICDLAVDEQEQAAQAINSSGQNKHHLAPWRRADFVSLPEASTRRH